MSAAWPLEATSDDAAALPPPWDSDVDIDNKDTESALLALQFSDPDLALRVCRRVFVKAEARGDEQAALHALYLASINLYNAAQRALATKVFAVVRERARGIDMSALASRIELTHAKQLDEQGERAQAMVVRQRVLDAAMALGDNRLTAFALGCLAMSANEAGQAALALSLCEQQTLYVSHDPAFMTDLRSARANTMALALKTMAHDHDVAGEAAAAQAALQRAQSLALSACQEARNDRGTLHSLDTLVKVLLRQGRTSEARTQAQRWTATLAASPPAGTEMWFLLQMALIRIDVHNGSVSAQTLQTLHQMASMQGKGDSDIEFYGGDLYEVLMQAQQQSGHAEDALTSHKRGVLWHARRQSAQSRQHLKMLRHTVLAMRAEAVEFITHDLLTPLAAAQTWMQAIDAQQVPPAGMPSLRSTQTRLDHARTLSDQYLGVLRAELLPRVQFQVLDIGALADDVCENAAPSQGLRLTRTIDINTPVRGDATLLTRALSALLADAFSRAPPGTQIALRLTHDTARGRAVLSIEHQGAAPSPLVCTRLYQHSFGSDVFDAGSLGLALAAKVIRLHRMQLRFETLPATGSRLRLKMKTAGRAPDEL
jgi:signal transduction histidine kinase